MVAKAKNDTMSQASRLRTALKHEHLAHSELEEAMQAMESQLVDSDDDDMTVYFQEGTEYVHPGGNEKSLDGEETAGFEGEKSAGHTRQSRPTRARWFDGAKIRIASGSGGDGTVAFFREKFKPRGGPAGGSGGRGGDVILVGDRGMSSLLQFRRKAHFAAEDGGAGGGKCMHGADAQAMVVRVPPGTLVRDAETDSLLCEVEEHGATNTVAVGGKGGRGNAAFKSNANRAPVLAENGERGSERWLKLELQLVADIGVIGCPNAGKSTLLSSCSRASPKVADYPFTTLVPNLGVAKVQYKQVVLADIPGVIEGASCGHGLGYEFLRHAKRCAVLLHVLDGTSDDIEAMYYSVRHELEAYEPTLTQKPEIVLVNKSDSLSHEEQDHAMQRLLDAGVEYPFLASAATNDGVKAVLQEALTMCEAVNETSALDVRGESLEYKEGDRGRRTRKLNLQGKRMGPRFDAFEVIKTGPNMFHVRGHGVERLAQMTNWQFYESLVRFQTMIRRAGIEQELLKQGAVDGDTVTIGDEIELEFDASTSSASNLHAAWLTQRQAFGVAAKGTSTWPRAT